MGVRSFGLGEGNGVCREGIGLWIELLYGRNERNNYTRALSDVDCSLVYDDGNVPSPGVPLGCASSDEERIR